MSGSVGDQGGRQGWAGAPGDLESSGSGKGRAGSSFNYEGRHWQLILCVCVCVLRGLFGMEKPGGHRRIFRTRGSSLSEGGDRAGSCPALGLGSGGEGVGRAV